MQKAKIDWKNHLIELVVVFIGITAAFVLNNWREERSNQKIEWQYIKSFSDDLKYDNAKLDTIITVYERKINKFQKTIEQMKATNLEIDTALVLAGEMAQINIFIPKTNTYESIKNSGNFNLLKKYNMRSKIIEYYESFEGKKLTEEYFRMYIDNYIIPFLFKNLDLINARILTKNGFNNSGFNNLVAGYYQLLVQVNDNYKNIFQLNVELRDIINAEH